MTFPPPPRDRLSMLAVAVGVVSTLALVVVVWGGVALVWSVG